MTPERITDVSQLVVGNTYLRAVVNPTGFFWVEEVEVVNAPYPERNGDESYWKVDTIQKSFTVSSMAACPRNYTYFVNDLIGLHEVSELVIGTRLFRFTHELFAKFSTACDVFEFINIRDGITYTEEEKVAIKEEWELSKRFFSKVNDHLHEPLISDDLVVFSKYVYPY